VVVRRFGIALSLAVVLCLPAGIVAAARAPAPAAPVSPVPVTAMPESLARTPLDEVDWGQSPEYRIVPGDELTLDYGPREDFTGEVVHVAVVRPDGRITVYPVGDVVAAGITPQELQTRIRTLLAGELRNPRVTVEVSKPTANRVHVLGRVKHPGSQVIGAFPTLLQALGEAGLEDDAALNSVVLMRRVGVGSVSAGIVRVDKLLRFGGDVPLGRFDIVYVPRSTLGKLDVFVNQFFSPAYTVGQAVLVGWELFNLDRVFMFGNRPVQ
jgi:protein involved in polysaccharide export with SLBB domain